MRNIKNKRRKNTFTISDIERLMKSFGNASIAHDSLISFLDRYNFENIYKTDDNSIVFDAGDPNEISIEFFNFENPLTREISIMYKENENLIILFHEELMKIA